MPDILLTGMPRSGTTLAVSLIAAQPDAVALAEPILLIDESDRCRAVEKIKQFMAETRRAAAAKKPVLTRHVEGRLVDNWVEPPLPDGPLRRTLGQRSPILFDKPLSEDFTLVVKHPAEFTALADLLAAEFPLYAIVRNPLAVLAAWQTVSMPVGQGRMPMAEVFCPQLRETLADIPDPLTRQVKLIEWQLTTYLRLPPGRVIRYEDMVADPGAALGGIVGFTNTAVLSPYDPLERYPNVDFGVLAEALAPILPLIAHFYPDFERSWEERLGHSFASRCRTGERPLTT